VTIFYPFTTSKNDALQRQRMMCVGLVTERLVMFESSHKHQLLLERFN
jgi:hypothetical protein